MKESTNERIHKFTTSIDCTYRLIESYRFENESQSLNTIHVTPQNLSEKGDRNYSHETSYSKERIKLHTNPDNPTIILNRI